MLSFIFFKTKAKAFLSEILIIYYCELRLPSINPSLLFTTWWPFLIKLLDLEFTNPFSSKLLCYIEMSERETHFPRLIFLGSIFYSSNTIYPILESCFYSSSSIYSRMLGLPGQFYFNFKFLSKSFF